MQDIKEFIIIDLVFHIGLSRIHIIDVISEGISKSRKLLIDVRDRSGKSFITRDLINTVNNTSSRIIDLQEVRLEFLMLKSKLRRSKISEDFLF